jgi:hypothetical protein
MDNRVLEFLFEVFSFLLVKMFVYSTFFEIKNVSQILNQLLGGLICGFFKVFQFSRAVFNILLWACEHM